MIKEKEFELEDLDDGVLSRREKIFISIIILIVFIMIAFLLEYIFIYRNSSEFKFGVGMEIVEIEFSSDLSRIYLSVSGGVNNGEITNVKFTFLDIEGHEYIYDSKTDVNKLSDNFDSGYWDWVLEKDRFNGEIMYIIDSKDIGKDDYSSILFFKVGANVEYGDGSEIVVSRIDFEKVYLNNVFKGFEIVEVTKVEDEDEDKDEVEYPLPSESNKIYFVDKDSIGGNCSDINLGGINDPWCSIEKANSALVSGDLVFIRGGNYSEKIMPKNSGSRGYEISYFNYLDESVVIFGVDIGVDIINRNYIIVDGFKIMNVGKSWVRIINSNNNVIKNIYMEGGFGDSGVMFSEGSSYNIIKDNVMIATCDDFEGGPKNSILIKGGSGFNLIERNVIQYGIETNVKIEESDNNVLRDNDLYNPWSSCIVSFGSRGVIIEDNRIWDCGNICEEKNCLSNFCATEIVRLSANKGNVDGVLVEGFENIIRGNEIVNSGRGINNLGGVVYGNTFVDNLMDANLDVGKNNIVTDIGVEFTDEDDRLYTLIYESSYIDAGEYLSLVVKGGYGTLIMVEDASYFSDGNGVVKGDRIMLEGLGKVLNVVEVDYTIGKIIVDREVKFSEGQGVSLEYNGNLPDLGANESEGELYVENIFVKFWKFIRDLFK